ncbi:hypothetical protein [Cupriavidus sp. UYPR2.512]|uniref:hypothetical protein n=1 Tax=Cupriavidus sp. UYPR2.512 TaxID=1080187 RepID=UPI0003A8016E|nr:hypothetical protein [Cupriavidus sp. UYPR2.512]
MERPRGQFIAMRKHRWLLAGLGAEPGSAGLRLVRHYKDAQGRILEITDTIYPADRVTVAFQLKRSRVQV